MIPKSNNKFDNAVRFDGVNDFGRFFTSTLGHFTKDQNCTISAFLRFNAIAPGAGLCPIFGDLDNSSNGKGYLFSIATDYLVFTQRSNFSVGDWANVTCYNTNIQIGNFYHVVITKEGANANNWKFYVNGELQTTSVGQNSLTGTAERLGSNFTIGQLQDLYFGGMDLRRLQVFDEVLTAQEIKYLSKHKGKLIKDNLFDDLVFDFQFLENNGTLIKDHKNQILMDLYGNPIFLDRNDNVIP